MITVEDLCEPEWADWYRMTPQQRWIESQRLLAQFLAFRGTLEPQPDSQSPFYDAEASRPVPPDERPGVHVIRRSGV